MSRAHRFCLLAAALVACAVSSAPTCLAAQGWIQPWRDGRDAVVRLHTDVTARVVGRVARVQVEEWFRNDGPGLAEGEYQYALPGEASFADLSLWQGDRELKGETLDAERARGIYEEIVRRRRDPALVELIGHGLLRARVFPIAPGETRRVTLRYTQLLPRAGDALVFRYAAGRAVPAWGLRGRPALPLPRPWPLVPVPPERPLPDPQPAPAGGGDAPVQLRLVADDGSAFRDAFSPTHELRTEREGGRMTVSIAGELRGDVAIFLPLARAGAGVSVAAYRTGAEDGYAMITLSPGEASGDAVPRDVVLVLDVSGSMSGDKIDQARRAIRALLGSLGAADRFRIVAFNSTVEPYRAGWTPASAAELAEARHWVDGLQASGSTDIGAALAEAFRAPSPSPRLPIVVFVTDGLPTVGEQDPDRIAQQAEAGRGRARVFAFGVGYDVNARLLDQLTTAARGTTAYVEPGEDLERPLALLAARIRHPVLTELRLAGAPVELRDVYPAPLPDLFAGDELVLLARYRGAGTGEVAFEGRRAGAPERVTTGADFPAESRRDDYIPRLWASRKIGVLTRELRLHGRNAELEAEVRELGLRYGILTDFTAYLVQEPGTDVAQAAPAAAPAFLVMGQAAVRSAETARARREAKSLANIAAADAAVVGGAMGASPQAGRSAASDWRIVAGRRFTLRDGVWSDGLRPSRARVAVVEPFSPAFFALLRQLPELQQWCASFPQLELSGARVALRIAAGGASQLSQAEIERLVQEFRHL
jgi:Ca-activated chloride channel family protein